MCERCERDIAAGREPAIIRIVINNQEVVSLTKKGAVEFHTSEPEALKGAIAYIGQQTDDLQVVLSEPKPVEVVVLASSQLSYLALLLGAVITELKHLERAAGRLQAVGDAPVFVQKANQEKN